MAIRLDEALQKNLEAYARLCAEAGWPVKLELLPAALEQIVEFYRPVKLYAFGSLVRGDFNEHSDLDLLIVVPDDAEKERRKGLEAYVLLEDTELPAEVQIASAGGFELRRHAVTALAKTISEEGKVLYAA